MHKFSLYDKDNMDFQRTLSREMRGSDLYYPY